MTTYKLTETNEIRRTSDGATIPPDPANRDYAKYLQWLKDGGVPDPAPVIPPRDALDSWDIITLKIAFAHENRIRALEGKASITLAQFKTAVKALI